MTARAAVTLLAFLACAPAAFAQALSVTVLGHYTENRGWNEAGLGPLHQVVINATVTPSGPPTLVFAEKGDVREPFTHFPQPGTPDLYSHWRRYEPGPAAAWRIVAERSGAESVSATTSVLANPQRIPLIDKVNVSGKDTRPRLSWKLPDLKGFDIERIRVAVRGGTRVHGRFMSQLWVSPDLPATATRYAIPADVLKSGERYVFQVMLEDLEGVVLENRSLSFSDPYSPAH